MLFPGLEAAVAFRSDASLSRGIAAQRFIPA
jgi:hypothetical protein